MRERLRRYKRWLIAAVLVCLGAGLFVVIYVLNDPGPQFKFLEGQRPHRGRTDSTDMTWYSFPGDIERVSEAAYQELTATGHKQHVADGTPNIVWYWTGDVWVEIMEDMALPDPPWPNNISKLVERPGWLTVIVGKPSTPINRAAEWIRDIFGRR